MTQTLEIPASDRASVQALADSGDKSAKDMLDALPPLADPAKDQPADKSSDAKDGATAGDKPTDATVVDPARDRNNRDHKPTMKQDLLALRRDRRAAREALAQEQQKRQQLEARLADLEAKLKDGGTASPAGAEDPKDDDLTKLLTKPREYLTAREEAILGKVQKLVEDKLGMVPKLIDKMNTAKLEQSRTIEILKTVKDFDIEAFGRGEYEDELYELLEEKFGFDEDMVDEFVKTRPSWLAARIKNAWESRTAIEAPKRADKAAAGSGAPAGGTPRAGAPAVTLEELNRQFLAAKTPEDQERVMAEIARFTTVPR